MLVEKTDISIRDDEGRTALHWAAVNGNIDMVRLLVIKNKRRTARRNSDVRKQIIAMEDDNQATALQYALGEGHMELVNLLTATSRM